MLTPCRNLGGRASLARRAELNGGFAFDSRPPAWQGSPPRNRDPQHILKGPPPLANPALGSKQVSPNCQAKFPDRTTRPAHCPKCDTEFDPDEAVRNRRVRARATTPEPEAEEEKRDDQVADDAEADGFEDEVDEVDTPNWTRFRSTIRSRPPTMTTIRSAPSPRRLRGPGRRLRRRGRSRGRGRRRALPRGRGRGRRVSTKPRSRCRAGKTTR